MVYTGDVRGAGTDANVMLVLYGEKGKSEEFSLRNKSDNFERNQVDKFKVRKNVCLGVLPFYSGCLLLLLLSSLLLLLLLLLLL